MSSAVLKIGANISKTMTIVILSTYHMIYMGLITKNCCIVKLNKCINKQLQQITIDDFSNRPIECLSKNIKIKNSCTD